ncbi:Nicotinamide-nucleotide amidohydrolase PncC [bioreactor metagenome]|uniref:Nicotinamide-nucleotide amidohydrolase PncC n=1 Tax=bioreactor metagenome TaxID=1076179 RepID=A0A645GWE6_9ZZZZ
MARGIYDLSGADYGVGITGIAGPDGGTLENPVGLCYICVYDGRRGWIKKTNFKRDRDYIRIYASNTAFEMVRKFALNEK